MPYKETAAIQIKGEIMRELDQYRQEGQSWNSFMIQVLQLIKQDAGDNDTTTQ